LGGQRAARMCVRTRPSEYAKKLEDFYENHRNGYGMADPSKAVFLNLCETAAM